MQKDLYVPMSVLQKQKYIKLIKDKFERLLAKQLRLTRVSAPLLVTRQSGLQDNLSGVERTVRFDIAQNGAELEIVQSLAKWKRLALAKYGIPLHSGIYTDMTAIRRDDALDETHSVYVDQWDWEKVISRADRTEQYLQQTVVKIVRAIADTAAFLRTKGFDAPRVSTNVHFVSAQQLQDRYPNLSPKQREHAVAKQHKTVFVVGIGHNLTGGAPHDTRAPDYDDWTLNGDLLFYHPVLDAALEISSMGIRVDAQALLAQLAQSGTTDRLATPYHQAVANNQLPLSIGGGIGQSRLCMLLLNRAHIGEVQATYWDDATLASCAEQGIELL